MLTKPSYTPPDIVTPIPGWYASLSWLWRLCSRSTHCIRVRIGAPMTVGSSTAAPPTHRKGSYQDNYFDQLNTSQKVAQLDSDDSGEITITSQEQHVLDEVADGLARLGRVKRVGLGVKEKIGFVDAWTKRRGR